MMARRKGLVLSGWVFSALVSCFLTGVTGDVPDDVVYTDLHKTVRFGDSVILTCQFRGEPLAVYWKKGDDPETAPNLVSWIPTDDVTGLCKGERPCQIMEMNENRSLVIKEVSIAEEGRYICRVSSYKGILIYNFTDIRLFSAPEEPYPFIEQCVELSANESSEVCSITANESIKITCSVTSFYPDLDLFFLHGSQKMTDIGSTELTNHDGTKNKSISIKATTSKTPYICVASDIPGSKDQRAATIFVNSPLISTTRSSEEIPAPSPTDAVAMEITTSNRTTKIVVPIIIIILVIGAVVVCALIWWKSPRLFRRIITGDCVTGSNSSTTSEPEDNIEMTAKEMTAGCESATTSVPEERIPLVEKATIAGKISFYELWSLAYDTPSSDTKRVHHVLVNLGIKGVHEGLTAPDIYDLLCKWKDGNKKGQHAQILESALKSVDFESRWVQLCEQRRRVDVKIPGATLQQIILDIERHNKIEHFLRNLLPSQYIRIKDDPVEKAMKLLREWRNSSFKENPFALISLALERCGCSPVAQTFFAGTVSFFELWSLSRKMAGSDVNKICNTLANLQLSLADNLSADDVYHHLCSWKEADKMSFQGQTLRDAFERADSKEAWKDVKEQREKSDTQVSENTLAHILWHIRDPTKIDKFLHKLRLDDPDTCLDINKELKDIIKEAMRYLNRWKKQHIDGNPIILLSHALEKTGCSPVDRSFFKVPNELITNITEAEVQGFVDHLTIRHIKTLAQFLDIGKHGKTVNAIHEGNKDTIFNTEAMITEWIEQVECSNYDKRWRLNQAIAIIRRQDLTDHFGKNLNPEIHLGVEKGTISSAHSKGHTMKRDTLNLSDYFEDELQRITTYLSSSQMKELFGIVDDDPRNELRAYVERLMADKSKQNWRDKLRKKLKSAELKDLIPLKLASNVYLCELLDVAFRLLLDDVYPLAEALGISGERLKKYRVDYTPDHLTKGTTAALIEFNEANKYRVDYTPDHLTKGTTAALIEFNEANKYSVDYTPDHLTQGTNAALINFCETNHNERGKVHEALFNAGYKNIAMLLYYGHEASLADEFAVASRAGDNKEDLAKISRNLGVSDSSNTGTVLRDWKAMVHPPTYNHRTSLADAVFPVLGLDVAIAILSGQNRENGSQSSEVIQTIHSGVESFELSILKKIIGVKESKKLPDEKDITCLQGTQLPGESGEIGTGYRRQHNTTIALKILKAREVKMADQSQESSIRQVLETWEEKIRKKPLSRNDRRELSDNLLMAGFKQFAFEIMTGFVPRPRDKTKKQYKQKYKKDHLGNQENQGMRDDHEKDEGREEPDEPGNQTMTELKDKNDSEDTAIEEKPKHDKEDQVREEHER